MVCFYSGAPKGPFLLGFPDSSVGKESACNAGDSDLIPGSGRSAGEGIGYPLQYSWASLVAHLVKSLPAMQATWFNPWVGKIPWRRERLPTPVFWPGGFHGLYSPWGRKESDTTEWLSLQSLYLYLSFLFLHFFCFSDFCFTLSFIYIWVQQNPFSIHRNNLWLFLQDSC